MTPKITDEMRDALHRSHGRPVDVEDERDRAIYVLMDKILLLNCKRRRGLPTRQRGNTCAR